MSKLESKLLTMAICFIIVHIIGIAIGAHDTTDTSISFTIGTVIGTVIMFFVTDWLDKIEEEKNAD